jgi:hypothetical protein
MGGPDSKLPGIVCTDQVPPPSTVEAVSMVPDVLDVLTVHTANETHEIASVPLNPGGRVPSAHVEPPSDDSRNEPPY